MKTRLFLPFFILFCGSLLFARETLPLKNAGFESLSGDLPLGWTLHPSSPGKVQGDSQIFHAGKASLRISHPGLMESHLLSEPLALQVGELYRLSGWIKTEKAFSDPTGRYPTPVAAALTMESFPFTNHSPALGSTQEWTRVETLFFATRGTDRVRLNLGLNGSASGRAWFDDIQLERVEDVTALIRPERVRWFGPAFRYTDRGWIFVHVEGDPYPRGYQYGYLLREEIQAYMEKLAIRANEADPVQGWSQTRLMTDALMLRRYDREYLEEMKGIADGAVKAGASFHGRPLDLLDIATLNSSIDLGQLAGALQKNETPVNRLSFLTPEEEAKMPEKLHKCSSFLANGPATRDGSIVFGQIFMWNGYTGVHWDVIVDVLPSKGHRLVYETFPGGIHSGADFYINSAGLMIGETTVAQSPFDPNGTPQSNRIRKAAQYASSIDEFVKIMTTGNNGLYTNDWLIGDSKSGETAILLLGTKRYKLWRSRTKEFPGNTTGFYWSINNAKDPEVRKEYVTDVSDAPFDLPFSPWNRDIVALRFYNQNRGEIDEITGVNFWNSAPINLPHACDGKITNSEMAKKMMFLAHYGKVTLREKFPEKNYRLLPDLPGATPHLSLGYSVINPLWVTSKLQELKRRGEEAKVVSPKRALRPKGEELLELLPPSGGLWKGTVYPAGEGDNWFASGSASYWRILSSLPSEPQAACASLTNIFQELNARLLSVFAREGTLAALKTQRGYDGYKYYQIPRIRGTVLLHQMRLRLGNDLFLKVMKSIHETFREKPATTAQILALAESVAKRSLKDLFTAWLEREDLPSLRVEAVKREEGNRWVVEGTLRQEQPGEAYPLKTFLAVETEEGLSLFAVEGDEKQIPFSFTTSSKPLSVETHWSSPLPVNNPRFPTLNYLIEEFHDALLVYGTSRQIEANHTLGLRFQTTLADSFSETFIPLVKDGEVDEEELKNHDLILLGGPQDNGLTARVLPDLNLEAGPGLFRWKGELFAKPDQGLFVALPSPFNPKKTVYLYLANSAMELYQMTKRFQNLPSWALFQGETATEKGYFTPPECKVSL